MAWRWGVSAAALACSALLAPSARADDDPQAAQTTAPAASPPSQTLATPGATLAPQSATPSEAAGANPAKPTAQPSAPITLRGTRPADEGVIAFPASYFADQRPNTALDMVQRLPGFTFDTGDTVRGFAGAAGNVLIDGHRPASKTDALDSILDRIPARDVERIELIRGGAQGVDMQGRTVLANVVRKSGDSRRLTLSGQENLFFQDGHSIPGGSIEYSQRTGPRTYEATLSRYSSFDDSVGDGRYVLRNADGTGVDEPARTSGAGGGVGLTTTYKGPLAGGDFRANVKLEETYFKSGQTYGYAPVYDSLVNDRQRSRDGEVGLNYDRKFGKLELETTLLQRLERDTSSEAALTPGVEDDYSQVQKTGESIARATLRYPLYKTLTLEGGGEFAYNFLDGKTADSENGAPIPLPSADVRVEEKRGEVFGQGTWKITKSLTLEAGVRFEFSTISETGDATMERSFFYPKPRALLSWTPDKDSQVRVRIEKKVGQLNFSDFVSSADLKDSTVSAGNPDLRPDQRWEYEVSYERRFWSKGAVVATLTHAEITDATDLVPIIGPGYAFDAPGNIGSGTQDVLQVDATLPLDKFGVKNGLIKSTNLWRNSQVTDPLTGETRRISGERPWSQNTEFSQDLPKWKTTWGIVYDRVWRETYYRLTEVQRYIVTPPFIQVYAEYKPRPDWSFRVEATNLIPFKFERDRTLYTGPRDTSPVSAQEHQEIQSSQRVFVRVRKTFG